MRIGNHIGSNFMGHPANKAGEQDSQTKRIQKQISGIQEQLKGLSENKEMSFEEKAAKRKELQEQMADLNKQLAERQILNMQENRKKNQSGQGGNKNSAGAKAKSGGMGTAVMQSIIGADHSMKQVAISNGAKSQLEGKASVLETEIKIDQGRGDSTERKEAKLDAMEEQINTVSNDMMSHISQITEERNHAQGESEKEEAGKTDQSKEKEVKAANQEGASVNPNLTAGTREGYLPIDIKL